MAGKARATRPPSPLRERLEAFAREVARPPACRICRLPEVETLNELRREQEAGWDAGTISRRDERYSTAVLARFLATKCGHKGVTKEMLKNHFTREHHRRSP
jgi:hypothetical protein